MNLSLTGLSPDNSAIAEALFPDFGARDTGANQIEALMNAAREEGRERAEDVAAEAAAGESI